MFIFSVAFVWGHSKLKKILFCQIFSRIRVYPPEKENPKSFVFSVRIHLSYLIIYPPGRKSEVFSLRIHLNYLIFYCMEFLPPENVRLRPPKGLRKQNRTWSNCFYWNFIPEGDSSRDPIVFTYTLVELEKVYDTFKIQIFHRSFRNVENVWLYGWMGGILMVSFNFLYTLCVHRSCIYSPIYVIKNCHQHS